MEKIENLIYKVKAKLMISDQKIFPSNLRGLNYFAFPCAATAAAALAISS